MRVVAFNGSPRKDGNTATLINIVLDELRNEGISTELVHLAGKEIHGCIACYNCFGNQDQHCSVQTDFANECIDRMLDADGIIFGSPTYFADVTAELKALIDRSGLVAKANADMFRRKVGAAVVAMRRGGAVHAFDTINHFFTISQMIIPGANYWNMGIGLEKGDVDNDNEGKLTMQVLGQNMAWVLKKIAA
ncbi:MAG: flavodoxin family protein [Candidatus Abyssobacteria bacterium SURF_17]|uniref:Flavodoxin family protein n=1 Tax=Candidatus Abyssobacteria bacterium SURF_17 TaxID=2093361 RepID=A0A419EYY8_9BACT|nr:MAG: flavodoxin family protein [Candidatus Abyssubacteria bacterium SURF_17]